MKLRLLAIALLALTPSLAVAQVQPSGNFTPGHALKSLNATGTATGDAGGAAGGPANPSMTGPGLTEIGITNTGLPFCINDFPTDRVGGYHRLCLGANSLGGGVLSYDALNGALSLPFQFLINGAPNILPGTVTGIPIASMNSALQAISTATTSSVMRVGFYARGDTRPLLYNASTVACTLNAGAGDNGSQVSSADGKCWLGSLPPGGVENNQWGARNDGVTDDTIPNNAAISWANSIGGATVLIPTVSVVGCSTPLVIKNNVTLAGISKQGSRLKLCASSTTDVLQTDGVQNLVVQGNSASSVSIPATTYSGTPPALVGGPLSVSFTLSPKPTNPFVAGQAVQAAVPNAGAAIVNWLTGTVTSYNSGSGVLLVNVLRGSGAAGPFTNWTVTQVAGTIVNDGTSAGGPWRLAMRDITLDGNAANNTANLNGRGFYSYAQGITLLNVDIVNTRGRCWEQHNALNWLVAGNDVDGIVRNLGGMQLTRCNQRGDPDMPGGIGGGGLFWGGVTDSRLGDILIGWPGPPISIGLPNAVGDNLKVGPNGNLKLTQAELFGGGNPDNNVYWPKYGIIAECITGQCVVATGALMSGGDAYQILDRASNSGIILKGSQWYLAATATSTTSLTIGNGAQTLTTQTGLGFKPGNYAALYDQANGANSMLGTVTSYNATTGALVANITSNTGSGTKTAWNVGPAFQQGGIQIGDAANGYAAAGVQIEANLLDILGPIVNLSWDGNFNQIKLRGAMNWADFADQVTCTYPSAAPPCIPLNSDEFDISYGVPGTPAPVRLMTPHGFQTVNVTTGTTAPAANTTTYLGPNGPDGGQGAQAASFQVPFAGFVQWLTCHTTSGPTGVQTYTYTLLDNTSAQPLTTQLTAGATDTGMVWAPTATTSGVPVTAGDRVVVRLVTSATAAAAGHACSFGYAY